jgi:thymidylate synthase (FAD)
MKLLYPKVELLDMNQQGEKLIEIAGRTCYKSEKHMTPTSHVEFVRRMKENMHYAMLEFSWFALRITCSRDITHQLVRHRHFSYAQESQHYIKYKDHLQFVIPVWAREHLSENLPEIRHYTDLQISLPMAVCTWLNAMRTAEECYLALTGNGMKAADARAVLPNSSKTEICIAGNGRSWMEFFNKRLDGGNTMDMQDVARLCFETIVPNTFELLN